jgi:uncharacterized membrane protein
MSVLRLGILYVACLVAFLAIDAVWLVSMNSRFYQPRLGALLAEKPNLTAAAVFYALYIAGVVALAVIPGYAAGGVWAAVWRGALLGLVAYATYDLTNLATLTRWPLDLTLIDLAWGTVVTSLVSTAGYVVAGWIKL